MAVAGELVYSTAPAGGPLGRRRRRLGEERPAAQLLIIAGEPVRPVPAASPAAHTAQPPANQPHNHHQRHSTGQHC